MGYIIKAGSGLGNNYQKVPWLRLGMYRSGSGAAWEGTGCDLGETGEAGATQLVLGPVTPGDFR
jgi:hypothetical protein